LRQVIADCTGLRNHEEFEANARLIAAAPEMLAALHEARSELWDISHSSGDPADPTNMHSVAFAYRAVCAAIAKAEAK
jgi:hypothetical protein